MNHHHDGDDDDDDDDDDNDDVNDDVDDDVDVVDNRGGGERGKEAVTIVVAGVFLLPDLSYHLLLWEVDANKTTKVGSGQAWPNGPSCAAARHCTANCDMCGGALAFLLGIWFMIADRLKERSCKNSGMTCNNFKYCKTLAIVRQV